MDGQGKCTDQADIKFHDNSVMELRVSSSPRPFLFISLSLFRPVPFQGVVSGILIHCCSRYFTDASPSPRQVSPLLARQRDEPAISSEIYEILGFHRPSANLGYEKITAES